MRLERRLDPRLFGEAKEEARQTHSLFRRVCRDVRGGSLYAAQMAEVVSDAQFAPCERMGWTRACTTS